MIQTYAHQKVLHETRLDLKTLETIFTNLITFGTNCSPFESEVIVEKAREIFAIGDHAEGNILQPGQLIWTALDMNEPPGKPLNASKLRRIILTHIKPKEAAEVRRLYRKRGRIYLETKIRPLFQNHTKQKQESRNENHDLR